MTLNEESTFRPAAPTPDSSPTAAELETKLTDINAQILSATAAQVAATRSLDELQPDGHEAPADEHAIAALRMRLGALEEQIAALRTASAAARTAYNSVVRSGE